MSKVTLPSVCLVTNVTSSDLTCDVPSDRSERRSVWVSDTNLWILWSVNIARARKHCQHYCGDWGLVLSTLLTCQVVSDGLYNLFNPRSQTWRNLFPKPSTGLEKTCLSYHVIIIQSGITSLHFQRSYPRIREQSPWTEWATRGSSQGRPGGFTEWTLSQIWAGEDYDALKMTITITTLMMMKMF